MDDADIAIECLMNRLGNLSPEEMRDYAEQLRQNADALDAAADEKEEANDNPEGD